MQFIKELNLIFKKSLDDTAHSNRSNNGLPRASVVIFLADSIAWLKCVISSWAKATHLRTKFCLNLNIVEWDLR